MSTVVIDYDQLNSIAKNADKAANRMNDYINDLTKKVSNKYFSLEGGQSSKTSNSQYYISQKLKSLRTKKSAYTSYATDIKNLSKRAKEIDKEVAKTINASKDDFIDKHDYIETNWWTDLKEWFIDMKNKCPLFDAICNLIQGVIDNVPNLFSNLKYWYKCGGGKEWIGFGLAIAGAVAAVLIAIASFPVSGVIAACAAIGACIAAANAIVNVVTSKKAVDAKSKGDPAWAKIYGDQDTAQDVLRQTKFGDGTLNQLSIIAATSIDIVQLVCDVVAIYDGIKHVQNTFKELKKYANQSKTRNFGQIFKDYIFNKKNYAGKKMRTEIISKRADLRTLRNYKVTKAMSLKQYEKTLTDWQKFAKKLKKAGKTINTVKDVSQKVWDFVDGKNGFSTKTGIDIAKKIGKNFQIPKTIIQIYDIYDKSWNKGFKYDVNGFKYMLKKA